MIKIENKKNHENILKKYMDSVNTYGHKLIVLTRTVMDTEKGYDVFDDAPLQNDGDAVYWHVSRKSGYGTTDVIYSESDILSMLMERFNKVILKDVHYTLEAEGDRSDYSAEIYRMKLSNVGEYGLIADPT